MNGNSVTRIVSDGSAAISAVTAILFRVWSFLRTRNRQRCMRIFFAPFNDDAVKFAKPILLLHGDGHRWIHDRPFAAGSILRVQVDQGGIAPPRWATTKIGRSSAWSRSLFVFDGLRGLSQACFIAAARMEDVLSRMMRGSTSLPACSVVRTSLPEMNTGFSSLGCFSIRSTRPTES